MRFPDGLGGFYELNPFPGCNQIVVSNHSWVTWENRGKGLGTAIHQERLGRIKLLGYDYAICTVRADNVPQIKILTAAGWKFLDEFLNRETGHTVLLYGRKVDHEKAPTP